MLPFLVAGIVVWAILKTLVSTRCLDRLMVG